MSGHSKWAGIKHKKALVDAQKGRLFSKFAKEITSAARQGGGNPDTNTKLRLLIQKAREANMPSENIERAIKRGTGELPGVNYEEMTMEGYGPGGVAIMVELLTDNKNRASQEIRTIFSRKGGNLAGAGSVSWLFHKKGFMVVDKKEISEEKLMDIVLEAGAEDMTVQDDSYEITTSVQDFEKVKQALIDNNIKYISAEITMLPANTVKLTGDTARQVLILVQELEDHEDVRNVYANFDIPDEIMKEMVQ
ncbi:MAG: YebC/PmpR family DNA-binding transcriptional regulator [Candidatus Omnitrophica bacterium]|nr:YebC/PmpR family DNA-binding transcriptional regulator [Candidatus Omnitrophota bacterium]MCM8793228.1 YebC/PmpR family DNA-binding transcriptional regulator [Candidatus Omnitrophota bacterium]